MNEHYMHKFLTPDQAVEQAVRSGDWIDYGWCTGTAEALDQALAARYQELTDVKVRGGILFHKPAIMSVPTWRSTSPGTPGTCPAWSAR